MTTETSALDFKSATLYAIRVVLQHADTAGLLAALQKRMADAGAFFENEPVVIDASRIEDPVDWPVLIKALRDHRLPVIGVVAQGNNLAVAQACGLSLVDLSASPVRNIAETQSAAKVAEPVSAAVPTPAVVAPQKQTVAASALLTPASQPAPSPTMVVRGPLRSGQRVYARNGDLIVMGVVSQGAEVIADGNIHIYGPLRGKAMAGAHGDTAARIFTTGLDAELVAIAGVYRVIDTKLAADLHQRPAMVSLEKDALRMAPLEQ
jgi:septum site-determining protein MinC